MIIKLNATGLDRLAEHARVPRYRREDLRAGIVHFGVGNFHRAHMACYLDDLFNLGEGRDWAIVGAGIRPADTAMRERLKAQDYLTTVVAQDAGETDARITAAMIDFIDPERPDLVLARLVEPGIRIVSLTITEGGYHIDPATGRFNSDDPAVVADLADFDHPRTIFGLILRALQIRRAAGLLSFAVLSCDNITGNGEITHRALSAFARLVDDEFGRWVESDLACPNTMVDRITPATGERERERLRTEFGIDDRAPIFCEGFRQWVVEDHFPAGRPPLEKVGVTMVEDVAPFELMKIRILNGGHAAISYPGALLDMEYVHEAMQDPLFSRYFDRLQEKEIMPLVPPVPDTDLGGYKRQVISRFANAKMGDTNRRVCFDGSNRQPQYVLPTALAALRAGRPVSGLALISAFWCRYCAGTTESGRTVEANDPNWDRMRTTALAARNDPDAFLAMGDIFGEVAAFAQYRAAFAAALESIWSRGTRSTMERYVAGGAL
ncbi:mannitol dehydrogenase family protein [Martelella mediterranea]|uniref:mannitol dehydrogenase family protein n=1 Tax=Martelella mediterranea TaxID=293089 RepID=UPI001E5E8ACA|nr:mannitol dehydrogenase family protein [Martelella mediterranea]MCD1635792.1 mannitol dehydrogenase family protein [Martelella mediterranea]